MFTGIIEAVGTITGLTQTGKDIKLKVHCPNLDMSDVQLGDSHCSNDALPLYRYWFKGFNKAYVKA